MAPIKAEEELHNYLRRYFDKVSQDNARQFADQKAVTKADVVPDMPFSDGGER